MSIKRHQCPTRDQNLPGSLPLSLCQPSTHKMNEFARGGREAGSRLTRRSLLDAHTDAVEVSIRKKLEKELCAYISSNAEYSRVMCIGRPGTLPISQRTKCFYRYTYYHCVNYVALGFSLYYVLFIHGI